MSVGSLVPVLFLRPKHGKCHRAAVRRSLKAQKRMDNMETFPFKLEDKNQGRAKIGMILLRTDETIESDFRRIFQSCNTSFYTTRMPVSDELTEDNLSAMGHDITVSAGLLPRGVEYDAVAYCCTSAAANIGSQNVAEYVRKGTQAKFVVDPLFAVICALSALQVKRIAVLTPYVPSVSATVLQTLNNSGFEIQRYGSFNELLDPTIAKIDTQSILDAVLKLGDDPAVEAIFVSCTNLHALDMIPSAEEILRGKPVICSNLALAWYVNELCGLTPLNNSFGTLTTKRFK